MRLITKVEILILYSPLKNIKTDVK